jgi:hypothetical protein
MDREPVDQVDVTRYDAVIDEVRRLMIAKNHDYGEAWRDMRLCSITDQILTKAYRIAHIERNEGKTLVSEGIASELRDIANYCVFALIKISEARDEARQS